ncbi:MAG: hypothetical protein EHM60_01025 [Lysobacterales bacterium]|jgi:hypothetical protein|nr:MAG: hypothetical protein EHM60_01025 [Xanthomonadales bacterium]
MTLRECAYCTVLALAGLGTVPAALAADATTASDDSRSMLLAQARDTSAAPTVSDAAAADPVTGTLDTTVREAPAPEPMHPLLLTLLTLLMLGLAIGGLTFTLRAMRADKAARRRGHARRTRHDASAATH